MKEKRECGVEFLLIGEAKLKIVIDDEELKKYKIDSVSAGGCGSGVRRSFWKILDRAKSEVGFDPKGDKVLVQFYPMSCGGCEVFVTKLGILPESSARVVAKSDKIAMLSKKKAVYAFDNLENLLGAVRAIAAKSDGEVLESDVYFSDGKFYLAIDEYEKGGEEAEFPAVTEFGITVPRDGAHYVFEHAKRLTHGDGIEVFKKL